MRFVPRLKVGGTEIAVVGLVTQHVINDDQQRMGDGHDGFLFADAARQAMILGREVVALGVGDGPHGLG